MRTSRFYPTGQPRVDSTYRSHFPCHQSNPRIKIPYGTSSGYRNNNPHPHNMKQVFNHPSKVREKKCAIVKLFILGLILRLAQRAIQLFWVTCKNCKHLDCEVLGPKYFGLILIRLITSKQKGRPATHFRFLFSILFRIELKAGCCCCFLGLFCVVPLPQIASIVPKDVYGQRVLQLGTPEESVPGQNKVYLPRRLCSSALRLVLTLKFGNLGQAPYHAGSCL